jgi:hypothetical protein
VKVAGDPSSVAAVLDVLRERVGADVEAAYEVVPTIDRASIVTPGSPNDQQLARIWIDLGEPAAMNEREPIRLYVVDGPWERVLVRPIARQPNPEVVWEEIGHIVELALGALRAGESIGVGRALAREQLLPSQPIAPATAPPAPERPLEPPPPARPRQWSVRGGAFYATSAYGSGLELASGPGALIELHAHTRRLEYGAALMAEYRFPSTVDRGSAIVRFEGAAFHALASGAFVLAPHHHVLFGAGGGVDLVHARASSPNLDNLRFEDGKMDAVPAARVLARYGWATSAFRLFAGVGVDVPLRNPRYLLSRPSDPVVLFEPWNARPFLLIGIETN